MKYSRLHRVARLACVVPIVLSFTLARGDEPTIITRERPVRFDPREIEFRPRIPDGVTCGVLCGIDGKLMTGDWKKTGVVDSVDHDAGIIEFTTDQFKVKGKVREKRQSGQLVYRLPHGLKLPLKPGDPITLLHDHQSNEKHLEWDIHISSGEKLIFATSQRQHDSAPRSANKAEVLFKGVPGAQSLFYWSDPRDNDLVQFNRKKIEPHSPISMRCDDNTLSRVGLSEDAPTEVMLEGQKYYFVLLSSQSVQREPQDGNGEQESEGGLGSQSVECFLLRAES